MSTRIENKHIFYTVHDDIFNYLDINNGTTIIVPHVCNNMDLFGAGFAAAIANKYPIVKENYHILGKSFLSKNPGYSQFITVQHNKKHDSKLIICNMIAQNGIISQKNKRPLNYLSLCKSMQGVKNYIKQNFDNDQVVQIHAPKFGSGLAGGNWSFISSLIDDIWEGLTVFIYDLKKTS